MMHVIRDPGPTSPPDIVLEGRFTAPDLRRYSLVPFQVEPGHHQIHVRYSYTDRIDADQFLSGGNTLDIGLFDPRGTETGSMGFRGWSGSDQLEFVVGDEWATPPYTPGPILAGTWNLLLGPYKVGPRGCDWSVEIGFDRGIPPMERELVRAGDDGGGRRRRVRERQPSEAVWTGVGVRHDPVHARDRGLERAVGPAQLRRPRLLGGAAPFGAASRCGRRQRYAHLATPRHGPTSHAGARDADDVGRGGARWGCRGDYRCDASWSDIRVGRTGRTPALPRAERARGRGVGAGRIQEVAHRSGR